MTSMTVVTDEDEKFREKVITYVYCHSSERATTIVTSSTQTVTVK
jgi:hypothetical protein